MILWKQVQEQSGWPRVHRAGCIAPEAHSFLVWSILQNKGEYAFSHALLLNNCIRLFSAWVRSLGLLRPHGTDPVLRTSMVLNPHLQGLDVLSLKSTHIIKAVLLWGDELHNGKQNNTRFQELLTLPSLVRHVNLAQVQSHQEDDQQFPQSSPWLSQPVARQGAVPGTSSLVVRWLRLCCAVQGKVQRLVVELSPTCHGATKPHMPWVQSPGTTMKTSCDT